MTQKKRRPPPRKGPPERFTPEQVIAALEASAGIRAGAARILKCARTTVTSYVDRYSAVREALEEILENRIDIAESVLLRRMADDSNPSAQVHCVTFYLKTMAKHRGYSDQRQRSVVIKLPPLTCLADVLDANRVVLEQCAAGALTPAEAKAFAELLDMRVRAIAQVENDERFRAIEQRVHELGINQVRH